MTYNTERAGFWAALRGVPRRMSLRLKLVTALLVLVGIALAVTTLVGNAILKNYLLGPYDNGLAASQSVARRLVGQYFLTGGGPSTQPGLAVDFVANRKVYQVRLPTTSSGGYNTPFGFRQTELPGPTLQTSPDWLVANSNHPFT